MAKYSLVASALYLATVVVAQCPGGNIGGMCYQTSTKKVKFTGVGHDGTYQAVSKMATEGGCHVEKQPYSFSGQLAPFNEPLSMHIRGPITLDNFAVYMPDDSAEAKAKVKRDTAGERHFHKRHNHAHFHKKRGNLKYVTQTQWCTSTVYVNGVPTPTVVPSPTVVPYNDGAIGGGVDNGGAPTSPAYDGGEKPPTPGGLSRITYYSSKPDVKDENILFMNNKGGAGTSGTWSTCFGNSLSFCNADGVTPASSPTCLEKGVLIPSNNEYSIWQSGKCDHGDCGYSYGDLNPKGWGGCSKTFVMEFKMPSDGKIGFNLDMPSVWLLNAKIPRALIYPAQKEWSCWPACGEIDLWEVLSAASKDKMVSTIHNAQGAQSDGQGGTSGGGMGCLNYFERPMGDKSFIGAVSLKCDGTVSISQLDSFDWPDSLDQDTVDKWNDGAIVKPLPA